MSEEDVLPTGKLLAIFAAVLVFGAILCGVAMAVLGIRERQLRPGRRFPERNLTRQADIRSVTFDVTAPPQPDENVGYGWVDRKHGLVRIPIEQAMELVAKGVRPQ